MKTAADFCFEFLTNIPDNLKLETKRQCCKVQCNDHYNQKECFDSCLSMVDNRFQRRHNSVKARETVKRPKVWPVGISEDELKRQHNHNRRKKTARKLNPVVAPAASFCSSFVEGYPEHLKLEVGPQCCDEQCNMYEKTDPNCYDRCIDSIWPVGISEDKFERQRDSHNSVRARKTVRISEDELKRQHNHNRRKKTARKLNPVVAPAANFCSSFVEGYPEHLKLEVGPQCCDEQCNMYEKTDPNCYDRCVDSIWPVGILEDEFERQRDSHNSVRARKTVKRPKEEVAPAANFCSSFVEGYPEHLKLEVGPQCCDEQCNLYEKTDPNCYDRCVDSIWPVGISEHELKRQHNLLKKTARKLKPVVAPAANFCSSFVEGYPEHLKLEVGPQCCDEQCNMLEKTDPNCYDRCVDSIWPDEILHDEFSQALSNRSDLFTRLLVDNETIANGSCMFDAVFRQLVDVNYFEKLKILPAEHCKICNSIRKINNYKQVRKLVIKIATESLRQLQFLDDFGFNLKWLDVMTHDGTWGDHIAIQLIATIFNINIEILSTKGTEYNTTILPSGLEELYRALWHVAPLDTIVIVHKPEVHYKATKTRRRI